MEEQEKILVTEQEIYEQNIRFFRAVKVKTLGDHTMKEVEAMIWHNSTIPRKPQWEEIPDWNVAPLDLIHYQWMELPPQMSKAMGQDKVKLFQQTCPIPMDKFPKTLSQMTAPEAIAQAEEICKRQNWKRNYAQLMAALNNYEMELSYQS